MPSRFLRSSRVTSDDDLQGILYSTLYSGRCERKFYESRRKVGTISYHTCAHDITYRSASSRIMEVRLGNGMGLESPSALHYKVVWEYYKTSYHELWLKEVVLLEETMELHKEEWHFSIRSILSVSALGAFPAVRDISEIQNSYICHPCSHQQEI